jgi:hypothetical protein
MTKSGERGNSATSRDPHPPCPFASLTMKQASGLLDGPGRREAASGHGKLCGSSERRPLPVLSMPLSFIVKRLKAKQIGQAATLQGLGLVAFCGDLHEELGCRCRNGFRQGSGRTACEKRAADVGYDF